MADLKLKSERQIQTEMLATLISSLGLNDTNPGSVIDLITQAAAQQDFAQYYQLAQVSRLADLEALTGSDLDLKAFEFDLQRMEAAKATGLINILREESFEKVSTALYTGTPAPSSGQTVINVDDASNTLFGTSGTLIIGRGTNNEEEVSYSTASVLNGNFYTITLDTPLVNNHALEESVILKQGNSEFIAAGTIVVVPSTGTSEEIRFETLNDATLLAGEELVSGVEVIALVAGSDANVTALSIKGTSAFPSAPFTGARAENPSKFTTGVDRETDDQLRDRIKSIGDQLTKGVRSAVLNAIVGLVDPISAKRVVSASVVLPVDECGKVRVYIDDGVGFEPSFVSVGLEELRNSATGGETLLQIDNIPIIKALVESNNSGPFNLGTTSLDLVIEVGQSFQETITIDPASFNNPELATAEEVAALINDRATLVEARTSNGGTKLTLTARVDENESIQIQGGSANSIIGFPTDLKETLNLYIDDVRVSKDGRTATLESVNEGPFDLNSNGAFPQTLSVIVDGKTANIQTASIDLSDVVNASAVTPLEIVAVLNRDLVGVTASAIADNTRIRLESGTLLSSNSKLQISGGLINDSTNGLNMPLTESIGSDKDYKLNRDIGLVELTTPLVAGQKVTVGSSNTRASLRSQLPEPYSPGSGSSLEFALDGGGVQEIFFDASFASGKTAQETADFLNLYIEGGIASVDVVDGVSYLSIRSNSLQSGSVVMLASTANIFFNFPIIQTVTSSQPNEAFRVSGATAPFSFAQDDSLVVVLDQDTANSTFSLRTTYDTTLTGVSNSTTFADSSLSSVFEDDGLLDEYFIAPLSGNNTDVVNITDVSPFGGSTFRYTFDVALVNISNYSVGDLVKISGLEDAGNNGNFVITNVTANYFEVENTTGIIATTQSGIATISQKRQVSNYIASSGTLVLSSAFVNTPVVGDSFVLLASSVKNVVSQFNNLKLSGIALKADISGVDSNSRVQITSLNPGSEGSIQISGGTANRELLFDTDLYVGISAYNYYTGLLDLVHRTIYGDDSDLVSFPGVGAAGVIFEILSPTVRQIKVDTNITLADGISITSVDNEVKSAVSNYINSLQVGEDVVLERIRSEVIKINGIVDVSLSNLTANIAIADNELARISNTNITIG